MKKMTYPYFRATCTVDVTMPDNDSYHPDLVIKLSFLFSYWDEARGIAEREASFKLECFGVDKELLKNATFESNDFTYEARDAKFVKREYGVPIEAFHTCDPKKRDTLIRQRRLVPNDWDEMVSMYGSPAQSKPKVQEVTA